MNCRTRGACTGGHRYIPPPYQQAHWNAFAGIPYQAQGPVGDPPAAWVNRYDLQHVPNREAFPNYQLDRNAARAIRINPANDVLFGYVCAMAWGDQGGGPGARRHVIAAWNARAQIFQHLIELRAGGLSRSDAYNLFRNPGILGLDPSFFSKLLYFFSPIPSFYIMDQWTAKSVNLLTGNWVVRMAGNAPSNQNNGGNYQAFCEEIDLMAGIIGCTGQVVEERLFSQGGRHPWPWRAHVRLHWMTSAPEGRYNAAAMHGIYPHIPIADF